MTGSEDEDAPGLDEYFEFRLSGVQPARPEGSVIDMNRDALVARMRDYFDSSIEWEDLVRAYPPLEQAFGRFEPASVRERLLTSGEFDEERVVEFLFRPYDRRWLYWELRYKLLNEARAALDPVHSFEEQRYIVQAETPRRPFGGRPLITRAVPSFAAVDPDARVFPRVRPYASTDEQLDLNLADDEEQARRLPGTDDPDRPVPNIEPEWIQAARNLGVDGDDFALADMLCYALMAVMHAPAWAASVPPDQDTFPGVPLPGTRADLERAAALGRRIADVADPWTEVEGVTAGELAPNLRDLAVAHVMTDRRVSIGSTSGGRGGEWIASHGGSVRWGDGGEWRNVPEQLWTYAAGGFEVLPKWLSYRVGRDLTADELDEFTAICRRLFTILELEPEADAIFGGAVANRLEPASGAESV